MATPRPVPGNPVATYASIMALCDAVDAVLGQFADITAGFNQLTEYATGRDQQLQDGINGAVANIAQLQTVLQNRIASTQAYASSVNQALLETANNLGRVASETSDSIVDIRSDVSAIKDFVDTARTALADAQAAIKLKADAAEFNGILTARRLELMGTVGRPGDAPLRYTVVEGFLALGGARTALPLIPDSMLQAADQGPIVRLPGGVVLAAREIFAIEIARVGRARFAVQRRVDPVDPSGDAVTCAIVWLDQRLNVIRSKLGYTIVRQFDDLRIVDGRQAVEALFSRDGKSVPGSINAPSNARFAVPAVFTYGPDGVTDVEVLGADDVTSATVLAPETQDTVQRVNAIESKGYDARIEILEQSVGTPNTMTYPSRAAAAAATVPANIQALTVLGTVQSGDGGDGLFLRSVGALGDGEDGFVDQGGALFRRVTMSQEVFDNYMAPAFLRWANSLPRTEQTDRPYLADGFLVVPR